MALDRQPIAAEMRVTLAVAAPLAAANLAQMAMQVTNAVMVGNLGTVPLAAAGLGNALNATLLMTSQGLLTAVAPLAAPSIGAGAYPAAGRVAGDCRDGGGGADDGGAAGGAAAALRARLRSQLGGRNRAFFVGDFLGHSRVPRCGGAALPADCGVS